MIVLPLQIMPPMAQETPPEAFSLEDAREALTWAAATSVAQARATKDPVPAARAHAFATALEMLAAASETLAGAQPMGVC